MIILGIDTATDILNLAIVEDDNIIIDYKIQKEGKTHSAILIPSLKNILDCTDLDLDKLEGVAVAIGPGSFTGLRIGLATAKGLAFSLSVPLIGVNTLQSYALKWQALPGILCPMVKARKGEYYFTFYQKNKNSPDLERLEPYQCDKWAAIKNQLKQYHQPIYVFGYGLTELIINHDHEQDAENIYFIDKTQEPPGAINIAFEGINRIKRKKIDDVLSLSPFYIRKSAAEMIKKGFEKGIKDGR